jgi:hypothetical protein
MKLYQYGPALVLLKMLILSSYRPDCLFFLLRKLTFCLFRNARTLNLDLHGLIVWAASAGRISRSYRA